MPPHPMAHDQEHRHSKGDKSCGSHQQDHKDMDQERHGPKPMSAALPQRIGS
jgi:hypothetical protein